MSQVKVKENESLDSALRRFKRQTSRDGIIQEVRKESIMKSLLLLVKRRARLLVKESINNYTYMGAVISLPLFFIYIKYGENYEKILVLNGPNLNMTGIRKRMFTAAKP